MDAAKVYGFSTDEQNGVSSEVIDVTDLSGTPNKILRDVLMMPSLTPIWAEEKIRAVIEESEGHDPKTVAKRVFEQMREMGMAENLSDFSGETEDAQ